MREWLTSVTKPWSTEGRQDCVGRKRGTRQIHVALPKAEYGESKMLSREGRAEDAVRAIHHQMEDTVLVEGRLSESVQMRGEKTQQS